jgi:transcriptional regulator with XRE-family HTH domain
METNEAIGARLRELRDAMDLTQEEFAAIAAKAGARGATRQSQRLYEKGKRLPDAAYLKAIADVGVDALYILTGQRTGNAAPAPALSEGDRILLDNFHAAPKQVQAGIKTTLGAFAPAPGLARKRPPKSG